MTRLLVAWGLVMVGLATIIITLTFLWWPGAILFGGAVLVALGALGIQVPTTVTVRRQPGAPGRLAP